MILRRQQSDSPRPHEEQTGNVSTDKPAPLLAQVPLGEQRTGARLQIALEFERSCFLAKRDHHIELPWAMSRRVDAFASVVRTQTRSHVVSHASVVAIAIAEAADHIYETFLLSHD